MPEEEGGGPRLREVRAAAGAVRRLPRGQRVARPTPPACATSRRSRSSSPYPGRTVARESRRRRPAAGEDRARPGRRRRARRGRPRAGLGLDGIIATNTTISRAGLRDPAARSSRSAPAGCPAGRSTERSLDVLRLLRQAGRPRPHADRGRGHHHGRGRQARLDAGATLLQAYTAFVYEGPRWPRRIVTRASKGVTPCTSPGTVLDSAGRRLPPPTVVAPGVPERFRPGNFVALTLGGPTPRAWRRRSFWIHRVRPPAGTALTLEIVVEHIGAGARWLAGLHGRGAARGHRAPRPAVRPAQGARRAACWSGEGYAAAPLFPLAERLRERGCGVTLVVAGRDEAHLLVRARGPPLGPRGHGGHRRRLGRPARPRGGPRSPGCSARRRPTSSTPPARAAPSTPSPRRPRPPAPGARPPSRSPCSAPPGSATAAGAGRRRGRRAAHGPGLRRRAGVPRRPGPLGDLLGSIG